MNEILMVMSDVPNGKAIAKCFYVNKSKTYSLNQRICALRTKNNYDSLFLYYILNRNRYFLQFDDGVKQTNLKKGEILDCLLQIPDFQEQIYISKVLATVDKEIQKEKEKLKTFKSQKKGLIQQLLTGKTLVRI